MARAEDLGRYFRVPADSRDLNYNRYTDQGSTDTSVAEDYTSDNTTLLDYRGVIDLLRSVHYLTDVFEGKPSALTG
jgi:UDP-glucose 4-epimerase